MAKQHTFSANHFLIRRIFQGFFVALLLSVIPAKAQQWGDYTLIAVQGQSTAKLIDTNSVTVKTWTLTGQTAYSSHLLQGGILLRTVVASGNSFSGGGMSGRVQKVAWDGTLLWDFTYSTAQYCSHHDICGMPNGNVLLIAYELKSATEVLQAGASTSHIMWTDKIVEVKPTGLNTGEIVWEWHAWDHLVQEFDASKSNYGVVAQHPELLNLNYKNTTNTRDWLHMNGVDYNAQLDQIVVSTHNLNEMYVIDHSTTTAEAAGHSGGKYGKGGDILYRWGNPAAYGASGTANFNVIHDAHWVPADCPRVGSLVGFNNGGTSTKSTVDIITPPYESNGSYTMPTAAGSAFLPSAYEYRHVGNGKTSNEGGSQQLPNGNMIVCIALSGLVYEIDAAGNTIWTYSAGAGLAQAFRYSACFISGGKPATPTISALGATSFCKGQSVVLTSSSSTGNVWSNGAKTQSITVTSSGTYSVIVSNSGCNSDASKPIVVTVTDNVPKPAIELQGFPYFCKGGSVVLKSSVADGNLWSTGATSASITVSSSGTYSLVTKSGDCISESTTVTITVFNLPATPTISRNGNTLTSSVGVQYQWFFNGTAISGANSQTYNPTANGNYQVQITDANGCKSALSIEFVFAPTGVEENWDKTAELQLFPIPAQSALYLRGSAVEQNTCEISIVDMYGRTVFQSQYSGMIDIAHLANGVYCLFVKSEKAGLLVRKFSVVK